jgi:biofilm PGA synthesis lipoprotein PgaB
MNFGITVHRLIYAALLLILSLPQQAAAGSEFIALAFHDIVDTRPELTYDGVTTDHLIDQLEWLRINNYHPVSINDLLAARDNLRPLPENPILLCWDDAYVSFYTRVLPLLKAYNYPAVLAVVGSWVTPDADSMVQYGDRLVPRDNFMSWSQLKEAAASGLVEIASHSNNLHRALLADPFGDKLPAAIAHIYDPVNKVYETDEQFSSRVRADLQASSDILAAKLGLRPRVLVWPFGRYNEAGRQAAEAVGMSVTLTLDPVAGNSDHLTAVGRIYPTQNPSLFPFRTDLTTSRPVDVNHFIRIKSQDLLEPSAGGEKVFSVYLNRVKDLSPSMVILDPLVEVDGVRKALFRNQRFPLAQDRLNRLC